MSIESDIPPVMHGEEFLVDVEPAHLGGIALAESEVSDSRLVPFQTREQVSEEAPLADKLEAARHAVLIPEAKDEVASYLRSIGRVPLLSAAEEVELSKRIEVGLIARHKLNTLPTEQNPPKDLQNLSYLRRLDTEGNDAKDLLYMANLRLVVSIAKRYHGVNHMKLLDIVQEGNAGLVRAVKSFDYQKGFKFSTYATWWIRQAINRAISEQDRTIRLPVNIGEKVRKMERTEGELRQQLGRAPTDIEIAQEMDEKPKDIGKLRRAQSLQPLAFEAPIKHMDNKTVGDSIADQASGVDHIDTILSQNSFEYYLSQLMGGLTQQEIFVTNYMHGLNGFEVRTLEQVGEMLGLTRQRVGQIKLKAQMKIIKRAADLGIDADTFKYL